ncbi:T-cell differentiation antigen CD6-like isoform X2 [Dendropsophus ebraccatus]|uniref:T-cell differentiation antigen CD6-like isoform X2 n=1 Tax=Dendropsophus ebraccatus TaxID=150705 RepID=UPI0038319160
MEARTFSLLLMALLWISSAKTKDTGSPFIRLYGSDRRCQGVVQVWMEDAWHSLCKTALDGDLSASICRMKNCGKPMLHMTGQELNVSSPFLNVTCNSLDDIKNCSFSQAAEDECHGAAFLNCSEQVILRLSGSHGPCAGRVEIFMDGVWGSVCHDGWDALDAEVTCRHLKCGSALSALGGSHFGSGPAEIHLNEVDCRGGENLLWDCSAHKKQECSLGEHAGVICADYRDVRLSGGTNNCSGRVEVYLHGVWATICDNHWFKEDSNMLCNYLGCGSFQNQTRHEHSPSMYASVICSNAKSPWDCNMYKKKAHMCLPSKAVGLICQGAKEESKVTESRTIGLSNLTASGIPMVYIASQYLVIACATLATLLLASILISAVTISRLQRQKKVSIQNGPLPKSNECWTSREIKQPDFSQQISTMGPAKSPRLQSKVPVPAAIPLVPIISSTLEEEEDYRLSSATLRPMVTFQGSASRRSSSTSSEEENWYENYRQQAGPQNFLLPPQPYEGSSEYDDVSSVASD